MKICLLAVIGLFGYALAMMSPIVRVTTRSPHITRGHVHRATTVATSKRASEKAEKVSAGKSSIIPQSMQVTVQKADPFFQLKITKESGIIEASASWYQFFAFILVSLILKDLWDRFYKWFNAYPYYYELY